MLALTLAFAAAASAGTFPAPERSTAPISIVYPGENAALSGENTLMIGSVSDPRAPFHVNGATIAAHRDGAFIAWLPVSPGTFTFTAALQLGATMEILARQVAAATPPTPLPAKPLTIDKDSLLPRQDEELRGGDWLLTRAKASPGSTMEYRIGRHDDWQPMREVNPALGLYEGSYLVPPGDRVGATAIEYRAKNGLDVAQEVSPGKITLSVDTPGVAVVRGQAAIMLKAAPSEGDLFPLLGGTRLLVTGKRGSDVRVDLGEGRVGWVESKNLEFLLPGAQPPHAVTETIGVKEAEGATVLRVGLGDRVPFDIEESDDQSSLTVKLYYATLHTNWIVYNSADAFVDEVRVKQERPDIVEMNVRLKRGQRLWGFWPTFDGNALKIELKRPPRLQREPLRGLRVFIDPGHMPSAPGAIGPLGTKEMDVNLAIAETLGRKLAREGAVPLLSRSSATDEVSLADRPRLAVEQRADIFISVHNNFLSSDANPFKGAPHGYSVFYYHPHSLELARAVYEAYGRDVPLPGEDLRFGNLLVCRLSAMPAILTESAYLTYPEQEEMLLDAKFRDKVAQAILDGLRAFLRKEKERQR